MLLATQHKPTPTCINAQLDLAPAHLNHSMCCTAVVRLLRVLFLSIIALITV